jgi:hypothetical protein
METNLRPLTLGEILDQTAQLYRTHFWLFAGISAVYSGALLALSLVEIGVQEFFRAEHLTPYLIWVGGIGIMVQFLIMFLFGGLAVAANNRAVAWVHLGEAATIRGAYGSILPRGGRYLWLMTIIAVIIWTPLALAYGGYLSLLFFWIRPLTKGAMRNLSTNPAVAAGNQQATLMLGLATVAFGLVFLLAVAYAVIMGLRYSLAIAASVVENLKARQALRRSIDLSKGSRGRIFVLALLVMVIQLGLVLMTQIAFIVMSFRQNGQLTVGARVLQQLVAFVTNTFIGPMYATGLTLFYYDQRVRKEGYDIEWMMEAAGLTVPAADATEEHGRPSAAYDGWPDGAPAISEGSRPLPQQDLRMQQEIIRGTHD